MAMSGAIENIHKPDFQLHFPFPTGCALAIQIQCSPLNSLTAHSRREGAEDTGHCQQDSQGDSLPAGVIQNYINSIDIPLGSWEAAGSGQ